MNINVFTSDYTISMIFTDKFLGTIFIVCLFLSVILIIRYYLKLKHTNKKNPLL
ncbi:hypothetical protein R0131_18040 [Clostridium sp. AL.422]|nr:hypothetical protein [Clostridium sp. AL.422]